MTTTRKDYERAARIIRNMAASTLTVDVKPIKGTETTLITYREAQGTAVWTAREAFVGLFAADNPNFDAERFREACKPEGKIRPRKPT